MNELLKGLSKEQIKFICGKCHLTEEELSIMDGDTLYDKVYDPMCETETRETPLNDNAEESDRCKMAPSIVTILGNALVETDEDED